MAGCTAATGSPNGDTVREIQEKEKRPFGPEDVLGPTSESRDDVESASQHEFCCYCWAWGRRGLGSYVVSEAGCICFEVSGNRGGSWSGLNAPWEIGYGLSRV